MKLNRRAINGSRNSRMGLVEFFKGCLPQILIGPFLNTWTQMKSKDRAILEIFYAKESNNLISRQNFVPKTQELDW